MQSANPSTPAIPRRTTTNGIPQLSNTYEFATRTLGLVAWLYGVYWIYWRWTATFNPQSPIFSSVLLIAETYGLISSGLLLITVWRLNRRETPPAQPGATVDVFITCYDEPLQLLRRTALGAANISYPHKTYILDDGKRNEVRALARELGIGYIRRRGNEHAKAGNLNNAFRHTRGEFILQLDADHVPLPNILDRMLGYFDDERVAFVQSPQDFYNTSDSFTHVVNDEARRLWEENRIFFSLVQPGKDCANSAFFCGSCGMLRRSALMEIGGFSTKTITEDMETSIVLHSRGWKSVYHGETLAYGLAPASAGQYHVQRLRWGQGSMQIMRKMNPLLQRGLTWRQRLLYFASVLTYFDGLQKAVFYTAPLWFFFLGAIPLQTTDSALLLRLVPYMLLTVASFEMLSRGTGWIFISERYNMTKFWTYILALSALFTRKPLKFKVTPKGEGDVPWRTYAPQLTLAILSALAIPFAVTAYHFGWITYRVSGLGSAAFILNAIWVCWNLYFAAYVVRHSILSRQRRTEYRFMDSLPIEIRSVTDGVRSVLGVGTTQDLNANGMSFRSTVLLEAGAEVEIPLALYAGTVTTRATVLRSTPQVVDYGTIYTVAARFTDDMPIATRDAIEMHCTQYAVPSWQQRYRQSIHVLRHFSERFRDLRVGTRRPVGLPAHVAIGRDGSTQPGLAMLEEFSTTGARLIMPEPVAPGTTVHYEVPGSSLKGEGVVIFSRAFDAPSQVHYIVGIYTASTRRPWWTRALAWRRATAIATGVPETALVVEPAASTQAHETAA